MSKVYIVSTDRENKSKVRILEVASKQAKPAYQAVRQLAPQVSLGMHGAKDFSTLKRMNRHLLSQDVQLVNDLDEFVQIVKQ